MSIIQILITLYFAFIGAYLSVGKKEKNLAAFQS